ncbi:aminotransferase-like domain-containing protein [Achromobacter aloeverae]|uniref:GntR family transcriptional regulator n=1 Tax=Achromobacter aloeverae TaxID=1750518 RepID=A0A4Q1HQ40_9BURK|nr:PLP-dependent aminotransferase family protein [Achromobacter aloeverae]RXN91684.1 GntR family transcriptional regulator [Achromobacter aloeverae]
MAHQASASSAPETPAPGADTLAQLLADDIRAGRLAPGTRLPTHRDLAARHGIAVATATSAYARLKAMGLAVGEIGRGTFVRDRPLRHEWDPADESRRNAGAADLSFNHPDWPGQGEMLRDALRHLAAGGDLAALLHQQPPGGRRHDRAALRDFLARERRIQADVESLFLVNGAQHGLDCVIGALLAPGDAVAVDALTYPGFKMAAEARGLSLHPVPARADGPDLDALDALCRRHRIRAIYSMPTLHNPLGWIMTDAQRQRLVALARRHDSLIIEDGVYAHLAANAPAPLAALAPERTAYVSSLSKSLASGLRYGYVCVPPDAAGRVKAHIRASHWSLPTLITTLGTRWIADGTLARMEERQRGDARQRQHHARQVFQGMDLVAHPESLFLWLPLPQELRMDRIARALAQRDIAVSKGEAYATTRHAPHALRLGLSSVPLDDLAGVLRVVRETIEGFPP